MADEARLPTIEDVRAAERRIRGAVHRTPVFSSRSLNERCGGREVFLKCENLQRSGSFKFRGAMNALLRLTTAERRNGVLTYSSGNHAGALALAGRILHVPITVIMPFNAPRSKQEATRAYGAEVILYDPAEATREALGARVQAERGMALVPPFDHPDVVAGQGTAALELLHEAGPLDALLVPCGGGGLLSGCALVAKAARPRTRVIGVEPALADDAARSFQSGTLHRSLNPPTIADGLRTPSLGRVTFPLVRSHVDEFRTVSEAEIVNSLEFLWTRTKLVVEPSGAVAAAPLVAGEAEPAWGSRIGVILSGGNIDPAAILPLLVHA
jgi:threo-3-hydroxy-L-aspartate ammonia-lyase